MITTEKANKLIKDLKEEKEYYKFDIRYVLYEKIIKKLEEINLVKRSKYKNVL